MGWKSKKDGTHFNNDKKKRDVGEPDNDDFNERIDEDNEEFSENTRKQFERMEKVRKEIEKAMNDKSRVYDPDFNIRYELIESNPMRKEYFDNEREKGLSDKEIISYAPDKILVLTDDEIDKMMIHMGIDKNRRWKNVNGIPPNEDDVVMVPVNPFTTDLDNLVLYR